MIRSALCFLFCLTIVAAPAQKLYLPRDIQQAYNNGTRSLDGRPGKNYWQNHGRYTITVTATPPSRTIYGAEQIVYTNNSPDTLRNLAFKLIVNIHKPGAPRLSGAGENYLTSGVHIDSFIVNGKAQPWNNNPNYFTTVPVRLQQALNAHDSVQLSI